MDHSRRRPDRPDRAARLSSATFDPTVFISTPGPARIPSWHHADPRLRPALRRADGNLRQQPIAAGWDFGGKVHPEPADDVRPPRADGELLAKAIDVHALDAAMPKDELGQFRAVPAILRRRWTPRACRRAEPSLGYSGWPGGYDDPGKPLDAADAQGHRCRPRRGLPSVLRIHHRHAGDHAPAGRRNGSHRACDLRAGQAERAADQPVTAIRRDGDRVRIEHEGGSHPGRLCGGARCRCTCSTRIPSDFSAAKKAALKRRELSQERQDRVRGAALLGTRTAFTAGSAGPIASTRTSSTRATTSIRRAACWSAPMSPAGPTRTRPTASPSCRSPSRSRSAAGRSRRSIRASRALLEKPVVVNWGQVPYSEGVGALWGGGPADDRQATAPMLEMLKPEGPIVFAGEHLSYVGPVAGRLGAVGARGGQADPVDGRGAREGGSMSREGGCACGEVRYRMNREPMFVHCCHCTSCQTETGSRVRHQCVDRELPGRDACRGAPSR